MEGKEITHQVIIFTNCCFYHGGSKTPRRIRKFQNRTLILRKDFLDKSNQWLIDNLILLSGYTIRPTSTTKVVRKHYWYRYN